MKSKEAIYLEVVAAKLTRVIKPSVEAEYEIWEKGKGTSWCLASLVVSIQEVYDYVGPLPWSSWKDSFFKYEPLDWKSSGDSESPAGIVWSNPATIETFCVDGELKTKLEIEFELQWGRPNNRTE